MTTEKMNKSAIYSWLIIALLGIYINLEQSFLTILSEWWFWLSLCGILLFCLVLIYLFEKSINYIKAVTIFAIMFLCAWNLIYLYAYYSMNTHTPIYIIVPFKTHYSPRHGDCVSFSYKGYKFYRKLRLRDVQSKYGENLTSKCNLELSLYKVDAFPYFYYINYIDIVEKNNYQ